jgi:hypothetical protein
VYKFHTGPLLEKQWRRTWHFPAEETLDDTGAYLEASPIKIFEAFVQGNGVRKVSIQSHETASFEAIYIYVCMYVCICTILQKLQEVDCVVTRAVESLHKTSDSSIFKSPTPSEKLIMQ